jgi:hypothetical protein
VGCLAEHGGYPHHFSPRPNPPGDTFRTANLHSHDRSTEANANEMIPREQYLPSDRSAYGSKAFRWNEAIVFIGIVAGAFAGRLYYAATLDPHQDEMLHLPSFRNHYGSSDIYPVFKARLDSGSGLPRQIVPLARKFYAQGELAQRSLMVLIDGHPLLHPLAMELVQWLTYDSLATMRAISVLCSVLSVPIAWIVGRRLGGPCAGLFAAALLAGSAACCYFGAIARTYALSELGVLGVLLAATAPDNGEGYLNTRLMLAAVFGQMTHWLAWPVIGPVVLCAAIFDLVDGNRLADLLRRSWCYCLISVSLLGYLAIQRVNPTLKNVGTMTWNLPESFGRFASIAPTGCAVWFPRAGVVAAIVLVGMAIVGAAISRRTETKTEARTWVLVVAAPLAGAFAVLILGPGQNRYYLPAAVPFVIASALCFRSVSTAVPAIVASVLLAAGALIAFLMPQNDPFRSPSLPGVTASADDIRAELARTPRWVAFPYYLADRLYRSLEGCPSPAQPQNEAEFEAFLRAGLPATVITLKAKVDKWKDAIDGALEPVLDIDRSVTCYRFIPSPKVDRDESGSKQP